MSLVNTVALNKQAIEIESKMPGINNLTKKTALITKATEVESIIPGISNLATKASVNTNATQIENKIPCSTGFITTPGINTFDETCFYGRKQVSDDGSQNRLIFHSISTTLTNATIYIKIIAQKLEELSDESIKPATSPGNSLAAKLKWIYNSKIAVEFKGSCKKQDKRNFILRNMISFFIV